MQRDPGSLSRRCPGIGLSESTGAQEPGDSACEPAVGAQGRHGACLWVPPQPNAPSVPRLGDILALRHRDAWLRRAAKGTLRSARHPGTGSRQPPSCSAKGTLPSIAATADARRNSSRQSRAIAGQRPPGRAPAETRRVPGRRCAPGGWLLRVLSRSADSPERGVGVGGSVRAWGGAGARGCGCACVCVCLWERWVCACVCERG